MDTINLSVDVAPHTIIPSLVKGLHQDQVMKFIEDLCAKLDVLFKARLVQRLQKTLSEQAKPSTKIAHALALLHETMTDDEIDLLRALL